MLHQRDRALSEQIDGKRVGFETPAPVLDAHLQYGFQHTRRGVRHDDVDMIEVLAELAEDLVDALRYADAALDRDSVPSGRAKLRAQRFRLVMAVVVIDGNVGAACGKLTRDRAPDATGSARDERNLTGERTCHR